jgi:hypothetical protein
MRIASNSCSMLFQMNSDEDDFYNTVVKLIALYFKFVSFKIIWRPNKASLRQEVLSLYTRNHMRMYFKKKIV